MYFIPCQLAMCCVFAGADPACQSDHLPKFENSKMVWNYYRQFIIRMYRIDVRLSLQNKPAPDHNLYRLYRLAVQTDCGSTHALLDHRWSRLPSGRFASLELFSADRHVAAVTARVQATAQNCAVCPLLRLLTSHTVCIAVPTYDLLNFVRCPSSQSTLRYLNHILLLTN